MRNYCYKVSKNGWRSHDKIDTITGIHVYELNKTKHDTELCEKGVMCAVVEDVNSVFPNESLYTIAVKQKQFAPPIRVCVSKDYNLDCFELLSEKEMKVAGLLWFCYGV